jgi:hypothetical protein
LGAIITSKAKYYIEAIAGSLGSNTCDAASSFYGHLGRFGMALGQRKDLRANRGNHEPARERLRFHRQ